MMLPVAAMAATLPKAPAARQSFPLVNRSARNRHRFSAAEKPRR